MFSLDNFYQSKEWALLLANIKAERTNKQGFIICEHCGKPIVKKYDCIGHHKTELTNLNVNDYNISLNPAKVALVHHKCHNEIHERYGFNGQKVYLVTGAPCSGKSSYTKDIARADDLILDLDIIYSAISNNNLHYHNARIKQNAFAIRDSLLDQIRTRYGQWRAAYVIQTLPLATERERQRMILGAELITIDTDKETCLQRAKERPNDWDKLVNDYFERYTE